MSFKTKFEFEGYSTTPVQKLSESLLYWCSLHVSKANCVISGIAFYVKWYKLSLSNVLLFSFLNPLTPMSDQDRISLHIINTISSKQVIRIKKNIN